MVDLRGPDGDQFLQFDAQGPGLHDGAEVRDHGAQNLRPVGDGAKHVGDIPALLLVMVKDLARGRIGLFIGNGSYAWHGSYCDSRPGACPVLRRENLWSGYADLPSVP